MTVLIKVSCLILVTMICSTAAVDNYQEKCTIQEGSGFSVDSCDKRQFLTCQSGRCMCVDVANQIYDYQLVPENSRSKRGTKKGGGSKGKIGAGLGGAAVGGIAGGVIGYQAGKVAGGGGGGGSSFSSSSRNKNKYTKEYACYGRVGTPCVLDYVNIVQLSPTTASPVQTTTSTSSPVNTTSEASAVSQSADANATVTAVTPAALADVSSSVQPDKTPMDLTKISKCVRNAECIRPTVGGAGYVMKTDSDPRIGACTCQAGYKATNTDQCVKSAASPVQYSFSMLFLAILLTGFHKSV